MKKLLFFLLISAYAFSQTNCELCVEQNGFYCGDDESNWTQYSPNGCVPNGLNGLMYLNDGWLDCVDGSDEGGAVPTTLAECGGYGESCDTVYVTEYETIFQTDTIIQEVEVPFYIYETIIQLDTIIQTEYITQIVIDTVEIETLVPEYIFITDTVVVYEDVLDTLYVDVIEEVEVVVFDTITEIEYVEFFVTDTVLEYIEIIEPEYLDCDTGLPCNNSMQEIIDKSVETNKMYDLLGRQIIRPKGIYIENGKIKYELK